MFLCRSSWSCAVAGNSRDPTVQLVLFVLGPGRRHSCRGADADSLGPVTLAFLQLHYIDKVVDVFCAGPAVLEVEETAELPQLRRFAWTLALHMSVFVQRQLPYGR